MDKGVGSTRIRSACLGVAFAVLLAAARLAAAEDELDATLQVLDDVSDADAVILGLGERLDAAGGEDREVADRDGELARRDGGEGRGERDDRGSFEDEAPAETFARIDDERELERGVDELGFDEEDHEGELEDRDFPDVQEEGGEDLVDELAGDD